MIVIVSGMLLTSINYKAVFYDYHEPRVLADDYCMLFVITYWLLIRNVLKAETLLLIFLLLLVPESCIDWLSSWIPIHNVLKAGARCCKEDEGPLCLF